MHPPDVPTDFLTVAKTGSVRNSAVLLTVRRSFVTLLVAAASPAGTTTLAGLVGTTSELRSLV